MAQSIGIIGAAGTLGRVVTKALLARDPEIEVLALLRRPDDDLARLDRCRQMTGGALDVQSLTEFCEAADVIVNLAARNPVGDPDDRDNATDFFSVNGAAAALVAKHARASDTPLVHFSSVSVYEVGELNNGRVLTESEMLPAGDALVDRYYESLLNWLRDALRGSDNAGLAGEFRRFFDTLRLPDGVSVYGLSKLLGETLAMEFANDVCAIRMCDVYGPGHESRGVIIDHLQEMHSAGAVQVDFGFRSGVNFIYIDDVCALVATLALVPPIGRGRPGIFNFCGPRLDEQQFEAALRALADRAGIDAKITGAREQSGQADRRYSTDRFENTFPDLSRTGIAEGLDRSWRALAGAS